MNKKHSWLYLAGILVSVYVLVMQQIIGRGFVRADEATELFFPIAEEQNEQTPDEEAVDIDLDEVIVDEATLDNEFADTVIDDVILDVRDDGGEEGSEEMLEKGAEEIAPSAENNEVPDYQVIIAPEVGTPEEEIVINTNLEELPIDEQLSDEAQQEASPDALTSANDLPAQEHTTAGEETGVDTLLVNDADTQEIMYTEPDTVITFDAVGRIDPTSLLSVSADTTQVTSAIASEIAKQNIQILLRAGGREELPEMKQGDVQSQIDAGLRDLSLTVIDPHVVAESIPTVSQLTHDTLFEIYFRWEEGEEMQYHRIVAFMGTDEALYVIDPYFGARTDSPQLYTQYITFLTEKKGFITYLQSDGYNPRIIEKTIAVPDEVIIKQENITVEISQQEIHMEDQGGESDFEKIQDFTIEKLSATEFILGESGAHLEFAKPMRVEMTTELPEGTLVPISVMHEGDESYSTRGLTTNPEALCSAGISSDESAMAMVQAGKIEFFSCGASTFMVDLSFGIGGSFNNTVNSVALQADGKIVVGGAFTGYNNTTVNRVVRLLTGGGYDSGFIVGGGFNGIVNAVAVQADGKIVVGGAFTTYSGVAQSRITRLTSTGQYDASFIGTGFNNTVNAIAIQADQKIVVGGAFTTYRGTAQSRITRLSTTGARDTTFVVGTGYDNTVNTLAIQADQKIVVGGAFTNYAGTPQNRITRLSTTGARDITFVVGTGFDNTVSALAIETGGNVVVGGAFTNYAGTPQSRITRLTTTGARDATFIGTGFNNTVSALTLQSDGKIIAGGAFTTYAGVAQTRIARLTTTGARDTTLLSAGVGFNNTVVTLAMQTNGQIIAGGSFTTFNGNTENRFVRFYATGARDTQLVVFGFNNSVTTLGLQTDGKIVVGGAFTNFSGTDQSRISRLTTTGVLDTSFDIGTGFNNTVNAVAVQADGKIVVGGTFTTYRGTTQNRITRLTSTGQYDASFIGTGFNNTVNAIAIQADQKIVVGGAFTTYRGTAQSRITRITTTGARDATFVIGAGFNTTVNSLLIQPDQKIVVGGAFATYAGVAQSRITRLSTTGARDTTFVVGTGFDNTVNALAMQADGKIVVGGAFTNYAGTPQSRITRLSSTGARDTIFVGTGFNGTVLTLGIQADQKIVAGGAFTTYRGTTQNRITRITTVGDRDSTFSIGLGFDNTVNTLLIESPTTLVIGGLFLLFNNNVVQHSLTRLFMVPDPTISTPSSGEVITSSTLTVIGTGQANGMITINLSGSTKTGSISSTGTWSVIFTGMTNGVRTLSGFSDYASNRSDIVTRTFSISLGTISISSATGWTITGLQSTNTGWTSDHQSVYFQVSDQKGAASGYYTTLSLTGMTSTGGAIITSGMIQWKADPVVLLSGTANPLVTLGTGMTAYRYTTGLVTFIKRDPFGTGGIFSTYGSKLRLRFTLPAFQTPGMYTGTITYTLYEN